MCVISTHHLQTVISGTCADELRMQVKADRGEIEDAVLDIKNRLEDVVKKLEGKKDEL